MDAHVVKNSKRSWLMPCAVPCLNLYPEDPLAVPPPSLQKIVCKDREFVDLGESKDRLIDVTTGEDQGYFYEEINLEKLRTENQNLKEQVKELKLQLNEKNEIIDRLKTIFTPVQLKKFINPQTKEQWHREDVSSAICLHSHGPKAYDYLYRKGMPLPPVALLERWCRKVSVNEGFLNTSLGFLRHCSDLTAEDRICVLAFDEIQLDVKEGKNNTNSKPLQYVQVVVAQGLWKSWKRPVLFNFDDNLKKEVLFSLIENLHKVTFPVVGIISNVNQKLRRLWEDLEITTEKPWFVSPAHPTEKVFTFCNTSHLLENLRLQFLYTGFVWNNSLLSASMFSDLLLNNKNPMLKLTDEHLMPQAKGFKIAEQLFSQNTAIILRECSSQSLSNLADFVHLIAEWFCVMNSSISSFSQPDKKPFGMDITNQNKILMRLNKWLSQDIIPNSTVMEDFQKGILITNNALILMYDYIKQKYGMRYILTNRLNHQQLNHLLVAIKTNKKYLTPTEFKIRLKNYIYSQNIVHFHGFSSNTENITSTINSAALTEETHKQKDVVKRKINEEFGTHSKLQKQMTINSFASANLQSNEKTSLHNIPSIQLKRELANKPIDTYEEVRECKMLYDLIEECDPLKELDEGYTLEYT